MTWTWPLLVGTGAAAAWLGYRAWRRLQLSMAKHPSLRGHSKMASRVARLVPSYSLDEAAFFAVDDAPPEVAEQRRVAFFSLAESLRRAKAETIAASASLNPGIADVAFTTAYRVPFPFRELVTEHLATGALAEASAGPMIRDLDGNESFDLSGAYGVNVAGYDFYKGCIERAVARAEQLGPVLGTYHPVIVDNVRRLREISGLDSVSFHMSGTEAVMQAVRLARYHTGRRKLVRFCGAYHGWWDGVQPGVGNPRRVQDVYTLNDMSERSLRVLATRKDIACVLINPLQALHPNGNAPSDGTLFLARRGGSFDKEAYRRWLQRVREVCTQRGIVLILDDVFQGFRIAYGGTQEYYGIRGDLVTYGKTLGGGLPVGVVCGRAELMKRYREDRPADICFARGTFNAHPYVMAAMNEFLRALDDEGLRARLYGDLDAIQDRRVASLNERLEALGAPVRVANMTSVWTALYPEPSRYHWMFQFYLRKAGLHLSWVGTGRFIFSHVLTDDEFEAIADRFVEAAAAMQRDGWWWRDEAAAPKALKRGLIREFVAAARGKRSGAVGHAVAPMTEAAPTDDAAPTDGAPTDRATLPR